MNRFRLIVASAALCLALVSEGPRARAADAKSNAVTSGEFVIDPPTLIKDCVEIVYQHAAAYLDARMDLWFANGTNAVHMVTQRITAENKGFGRGGEIRTHDPLRPRHRNT